MRSIFTWLHRLTAIHSVLTTLMLLLATLTAHAAKNNDASLKVALRDARRAASIVQGNGRHIVYIFFDPNCGYCPLLYRNLQPLIKPNDLQLRWIPVAIVDATSLGKAGAILEADVPAATLDRNEMHYDTNAYTGGIAERIPNERTEARVRANEALLNRVAIPVVPTMFFADKDGEIRVMQGALSPLALRRTFERMW